MVMVIQCVYWIYSVEKHGVILSSLNHRVMAFKRVSAERMRTKGGCLSHDSDSAFQGDTRSEDRFGW